MKATFSILLLTSLFVFSANAMSKKPPEKNKETVEKQYQPKVSGKSLGYHQMGINGQTDSDGNLTLTATVISRLHMADSTFQWKIPKHLKVIAGDLTGDIDMTKGMETTFEITLSKKELLENDQIFFFAYKNKSGERHGGSTSYVYKTQDLTKSGLKKAVQKKIKYYE